MKIRIMGACGSGKSTIAKEISRRFGVPYYEIDNIIWDRSEPNQRYPQEIRDANFKKILNSESWIIEGVQHNWTQESFLRADMIFILNPNVFIRDFRIIKRFIRSRTGIEPWNYKQSLSNLWKMIKKWNHGYDFNEVLEITKEHTGKRFIVKSGEEIIGNIKTKVRVNSGWQ